MQATNEPPKSGFNRLAQLLGWGTPGLSTFLLIWLSVFAVAPFLDRPIAIYMENDDFKDNYRDAATWMAFMGLYQVHILTLAIIVALPSAKRLVAGYLFTMVGSTVLYTILKIIVGRARPSRFGPFQFDMFSFGESRWHSFPSGEATSAMAFATLLGIYFPRSRWIFWFLGAWTSLGRVAMNRHYLSDAVFGAGLGILCAFFVAHWLGEDHYRLVEAPNRDNGSRSSQETREVSV